MRQWCGRPAGRRAHGLLSLFIVALLGLTACGSPAAAPAATPTATPAQEPAWGRPAYWPTTGWRTSAPEAQGVDSAALLRALQHVDAAGINLRSLTVIRNGYIVLDAYYQPFVPGRQYPVYSVTKSVTGVLTGIALQEGVLKSLQQPVLSFFPEAVVANRDAAKEAITVQDLVTLQPGLNCADSTAGSTIPLSSGWVQSILDMPMAGPPGQSFVYCSRAAHLLSAILTSATGMNLELYAASRLFAPLGLQPGDWSWQRDPEGLSIGGYGLALRAHDMAKLGLLFLAGGQWDGRQVVPAAWMADATRPHATVQPGKDYGYLFWVYPSHFAAEGLGDQLIQVVRDRNMVVVITASHDGISGSVMQPLLDDYLIPAARADGPLPANPAAEQALAAQVATLANPVQPVPPLPALAGQVSGSTYTLTDNPFGWQALRFQFKPGAADAGIIVTADGGPQQVTAGLDNVYRLNPEPNNGLSALRGRWTDAQTFTAHELLIGSLEEYDIRLHFAPPRLQVHVDETVFHSYTGDITGTVQLP